MKKRLSVVIGLVLAVIIGVLLYAGFINRQNKTQPAPTPATVLKTQQPQKLSFNKAANSTVKNGSLWQVVNKQRPFDPKEYVPADLVVPTIPLRSNITGDEKQLRQEAATALEAMYVDGVKAGVDFNVQSGYRSYVLQVNVYGNEVRNYGQTQADSESARPGYSEHQTGLAVDLGTTSGTCEIDDCFASTPEGKWIAANGYKYGFILRYPEGKDAVTGYRYEPWHFRYVGVTLATEMHNQNVQTLEEFFSLPSAPDY